MLAELPAVLVSGPRASGKTTTALQHAKTVVRLDREAEAGAFRADPDAALRGLAEPVLLDEWQAVPGVLGAVKRAVDGDAHGGRFILTGSVRADLDAPGWPGTGRLVRVAMYGLTERELIGALDGDSFIDRVARGEPAPEPTDSPDLRGYVEMALRGGFPEPALRLSEANRADWLESYVDQLVTRDVEDVDGGRDPDRLRRYLEAYTLNTAGQAEHKRIFDAASITARTAGAYEQLLKNLLIVESLPAWATNRLKRLVRGPKRYLVEPSLMVGVLRVDVATVLRDADLLGRLIETFALAQLRSELSISATRPRLYHLRDEHGRHEVDLVAELAGGRVVAIEIKATSAPTPADARHLVWLRDQLGDRFAGGVVLHTGPRVIALDSRISAVPIASLWAT